MPRKGLVALTVPIVLSLASCGESDGSDSSDATTDAGGDSLVLTWDGTDCVYEGPAEVTAGAVTVDYVNNDDGSANIWVIKLDSTTVQDVMDEFVPEPRTSASGLPGTSDMGAGAPADPGETIQWEKNLAAGEYVLNCTRSRVGAWFGSGLTVVSG